MRVGVSVRSAYTLDDPRVGARWMVERAAAARDAGLDSLFVGDHHSTGPSGYYQNTPILGRMLAEWGEQPRGRAHAAAAVAPGDRRGAARDAGVDRRWAGSCCSARSAAARSSSRAMGVSQRHRVARFEQGLDIIRRLLAGEEVTATDGPYRVEAARVAPVTARATRGVDRRDRAEGIDRAARLGDGWLANADVVPTEAAEQAAAYREACARARARTRR